MSVAARWRVAQWLRLSVLILGGCAPVTMPQPPGGTAAHAAAIARLPPPPPPIIDVAPYFAEGATAAANAALEAGEPARALILLKAAGSALPVRYLRAQALWRAGRLDAAAEELELLVVH